MCVYIVIGIKLEADVHFNLNGWPVTHFSFPPALTIEDPLDGCPMAKPGWMPTTKLTSAYKSPRLYGCKRLPLPTLT